jgi:hypothetical protein
MKKQNTAFQAEEKSAQEESEHERRRRAANPCLGGETKVVATISNWDLGKKLEPGINPSIIGKAQVRARFSRVK